MMYHLVIKELQCCHLWTNSEENPFTCNNIVVLHILQALDKNISLAVNGKCVTTSSTHSCGGQILPKILPEKQKYTVKQAKLKEKSVQHA